MYVIHKQCNFGKKQRTSVPPPQNCDIIKNTVEPYLSSTHSLAEILGIGSHHVLFVLIRLRFNFRFFLVFAYFVPLCSFKELLYKSVLGQLTLCNLQCGSCSLKLTLSWTCYNAYNSLLNPVLKKQGQIYRLQESPQFPSTHTFLKAQQ